MDADKVEKKQGGSMAQYGYILNQEKQENRADAYKKKDLEKMTLFHLREICRKVFAGG